MIKKWQQQETKNVIELKNKELTWAAIAQEMSSKFDKRFTIDQCRGHWRLNKHFKDDVPKPDYKETTEILKDGSITTDKLIELSENDIKDTSCVLKAHGYSPAEWEIVNAKSSMWNHFNKEMVSPKTMYASKITVKPVTSGFDFNKLLESIKQVPEVNIKPIHTKEHSYLNIPLADMHFGIATYEYYKETQAKVINLIEKGHEEILFIIGNDLFHHDNHKNQTASGREIEQADMVQAWEHAKQFYYPLFARALKCAEKVKITYIKGNHSESMEWTFVQMLKERYEQVTFDDRYKERKVHMLGLNFIGATHGDKKKVQNLSENFAVEFPIEWSMASTRTVLTGHLHHERVWDKGGIVLRQLPSGINPDIWHDDMGYTTSHKRFQVHEYSYDSEDCIHYV